MIANMVDMTTVSGENSFQETAIAPTVLPFHLSLCVRDLASNRYFDGSHRSGRARVGWGIEIKSLTTAPAGEWA